MKQYLMMKYVNSGILKFYTLNVGKLNKYIQFLQYLDPANTFNEVLLHSHIL